MVFVLEILGTIAFAISGAMVGVRAKMDILGVSVLGMTTAVGGGIIRDLVIGVTPPSAFQNPVYALVAIAISVIVFIPAISSRIYMDSFHLNLIDAIGLGIFTVVGVESGAAFQNPFLQLFLGVVTGVGGGVLRDMFATEKPMVFVRHFYAIPSMIGAGVCIVLYPVNKDIAMISATIVIVLLRLFAAKYRWHLPKAK